MNKVNLNVVNTHIKDQRAALDKAFEKYEITTEQYLEGCRRLSNLKWEKRNIAMQEGQFQ